MTEVVPSLVRPSGRPALDEEARRPESSVRPLFSLRPIRFVALLAVVTMIVARGVLPALRGAVVGISDFIDSVDLLSGTLSQLLAFVLVGLIATELWDLAQTRASLVLRAAAIVLCPPLVLATIFTVAMTRPPAIMSLGLSAVAGSLVVVFGLDAAREPSTRGAAWVPILVGFSSMVRGGGAFVAEQAQSAARDVESISRAFTVARVSATAAFAIAAIGVVVGLVWLARHERRFLPIRTGLVIVGALLLTQVAAQAIDDTTPTWQVVARRATQELLSRPPPYLPEWVRVLGAVLPVLLAFGLLSLRRAVPAVLSAVAMLVLVGPTAEVPILSLVAVSAALALWLSSRDPRGVWAALVSAPRSKRATAPQPVASQPVADSPPVDAAAPSPAPESAGESGGSARDTG